MFRACNFISPLVRPAVHKFRSRPPLFLYLSVRSAAMLPIYRRGYSMSTIIISYSLFAQQKAARGQPSCQPYHGLETALRLLLKQLYQSRISAPRTMMKYLLLHRFLLLLLLISVSLCRAKYCADSLYIHIE